MNTKSTPKVIAHRGFRNEFPENSLLSIKRALMLDVHAIEFDVDLSLDGIAVLMHQETLGPNNDWTKLILLERDEGRSWVNDNNFHKFEKLDSGSWFSKEFAGLYPTTLEQVTELDWGATTALLEIKDPFYFKKGATNHEHANRILDSISPIVSDFLNRGGKLELLSYTPNIVEMCARYFPGLTLFSSLGDEHRGQVKEIIAERKSLGANGLIISDEMLMHDPTWISIAHDQGLEVVSFELTPDHDHAANQMWTSEKRKPMWGKMVSLGVDRIISDFPLALTTFLNSEI